MKRITLGKETRIEDAFASNHDWIIEATSGEVRITLEALNDDDEPIEIDLQVNASRSSDGEWKADIYCEDDVNYPIQADEDFTQMCIDALMNDSQADNNFDY